MKRTPLKRSWFKTRGPSWRSSPEYRRAVETAFEPHTRGDSIKCVLCGQWFQPSDITPCHIRSVGANFEMRAEPLNIIPACFKCHGRYEGKTVDGKKRAIEERLPGRWTKLAELKRTHYAEVER